MVAGGCRGDTASLRTGQAVLYPEGMEKRDADNKAPKKSQKRRSGAQPGNQNGRKHGFYSSFVTPAERRKLKEASGLEGLKHELDFLRVKLGTMMSNADVTLSQVAAAVGVIARVATVEHRISRPQAEQEELADSLQGVIEGIAASIGLLPRESDPGTDIWAGTFLEDAGDGGRV